MLCKLHLVIILKIVKNLQGNFSENYEADFKKFTVHVTQVTLKQRLQDFKYNLIRVYVPAKSHCYILRHYTS